MTMYDGAFNVNTARASLVATSNTAPSPQVCSFSVATSTNYEAFRAFDTVSNSSGVNASTLPLSWMIYLGSAKLINKYLLTANQVGGNANPKSWVLQGTNNAAATAADAKNANDWTDLDTRTDILSFTPYFTFSNDTSYNRYRLYVTKNRAGETTTCTYCLIGEIHLVEQIIPIVCDTAENIETTVSVLANIIITGVVGETSTSFDTNSCTQDREFINIDESTVGTVDVNVYQSDYVSNCSEESSSFYFCAATAFVYADVAESLGSSDSIAIYNTFVTNIIELSEGTVEVTSTRIHAIFEECFLNIADTTTSEAFIAVYDVVSIIDQTVNILNLVLNDFLTILEVNLINWNSTNTITDTFSVYEDIKLQFIQTINDALSLTDSPSAMLELLLSEFITFTETTLPNWNTTRTINESIALTDSFVQVLELFITESLTLTDAQVVQLQLFLVEFVSLSESAIPNWNTTRTVNDSLTVTDILYQQLTLILTEALTCTDSAPLCQLGLAIYEYLGFTELLSSPGRFSVDTTDTLDAVDSLTFGYAQVISDVFSLVDTTDTIRLLLNTVAEGLGLSESIAASLNSVLPIAESLTLIDTASSQGRLYNIVHDTLLLNVVVELDGEVWECYVLNTPKFLPSIYSGFNFNSYCVFQNRAYGCKADGIYELTGDTDNGTIINTGVQLSETKFGLPNQKRFRKAYIGVSGTTPLLTMETETGETKTYSIDTDGEVDASRSLRSKKWKLTVTDFESLDFIKLVPIVLAK